MLVRHVLAQTPGISLLLFLDNFAVFNIIPGGSMFLCVCEVSVLTQVIEGIGKRGSFEELNYRRWRLHLSHMLAKPYYFFVVLFFSISFHDSICDFITVDLVWPC